MLAAAEVAVVAAASVRAVTAVVAARAFVVTAIDDDHCFYCSPFSLLTACDNVSWLHLVILQEQAF